MSGRWAVITGGVASRHRSKRQARVLVRKYSSLGARLRRYRRSDYVWSSMFNLMLLRGWAPVPPESSTNLSWDEAK